MRDTGRINQKSKPGHSKLFSYNRTIRSVQNKKFACLLNFYLLFSV